MSRVPLLEPVVLITSVPPGSLGRKKRHAMESAPVDSSRLGSRKKLCLGPGLQVGSPLPSTDFEVLTSTIGQLEEPTDWEVRQGENCCAALGL
jgi:hypothetical protein